MTRWLLTGRVAIQVVKDRVSQLTQRFRGSWDYFTFVYGRYWPVAVSAVLFAVAVVSDIFGAFVPWLSAIAVPVTLAGFVGSCALLLWDFSSLRKDRGEYILVSRSETPPVPQGIEAITLGKPTGGREQLIIVGQGSDAAILSDGIKVQVTSPRFSLPAELSSIGNRMMLQVRVRERAAGRSHRATRFNGRLMRLETELTGQLTEGSTVVMRQVGYFDGESSNEVWDFDVTFLGEPIENPVRRYLISRHGELIPMEKCRLANIIGITMVVVTADGMVLFVRQSRRNSVAPGAVSASASGSLEWKDGRRGPHTLRSIILRGMKRELAEECGVRPDEIHGAALTGFYRWWNRGAKPEFCGIARSSATWDEIRTRPISGREREYTDGRFAVPLSDLLERLELLSEAPERWCRPLPREVVAEAWTQAFEEVPQTAESLVVNPSCEAAWRAAALELSKMAR